MEHNASIIGEQTGILLLNQLLYVKRVFSILNDSFGTQQDGTLQDYNEASLMLQLNYK